MNTYKEEVYLLYLSAKLEGSNSAIPTVDVNSCYSLRLHHPIKSSDDTLQRDSHHSVALMHDHINYNSTNHNNKAGFYAFNTFINSPDDECLL